MDLQRFVNIFFRADNPIFYTLFFTAIILTTLYFIHKYVRLPDFQKHQLELHEVHLRNARVMAMFAELYPDPLIRVDICGKIDKTNDSAKKLIGDIESKNIIEILPEIDFPIEAFINKDKTKTFIHKIEDRTYSITFKGISYLKIGQLYFNDLTERIHSEDKLKLYQNQLKQLMSHQQNLVEEERSRLARELHDSIGHNLVVMKVAASNALEYASDKTEIDYYEKQISALENTITELKGILHNLKPKVLEEFGLEAAIRTMSNYITKESKINGHVSFVGFEERLDYNFELAIYRVIQEALNNIVKHSKASEYDINLMAANGKIKIMISDDGIGFNCDNSLSNSKGFGLRSIKERIEEYSGSINFESTPDDGSLISIELPKKGKEK
jgi:signal transduction histidine kinase